MKFVEKSYELTDSKIKKDIKFVLFSDLHRCEKYKLEKDDYLINYIKKEEPDVILIPGDIIEDSDISLEQQDQAIEFLTKLSKANDKKKDVKIIISLGNHEIMTKKPELLPDNGEKNKSKLKWVKYVNKEFFRRLGQTENIILLNNKSYYDEEYNINYKGYTLEVSYFEKAKEDKDVLTGVVNYINDKIMIDNYEDAYNLSLFHASNSLLDDKVLEDTNFIENCDLMVSGHMHGGGPHFGRFGLKKPCGGWLPKYVSGQIDKTSPTGKKMTAIITTGVSKLNISVADKILKPEVVKIMVKTNK